MVSASGVHGVVFMQLATNKGLPPPPDWTNEPHRVVLACNHLY